LLFSILSSEKHQHWSCKYSNNHATQVIHYELQTNVEKTVSQAKVGGSHSGRVLFFSNDYYRLDIYRFGTFQITSHFFIGLLYVG
jgi:hypothetical protein